jgi:hypothetical protein
MAESLADWLVGIKLAEYTLLLQSSNITTIAQVAALNDQQLVRSTAASTIPSRLT